MQTLMLVLKLLPAIIQAIQSVEEAVPQPGVGPDKKQLILDIVRGILGDEGLVPAIAKVIDLVVALLNKLGVFKAVSK